MDLDALIRDQHPPTDAELTALEFDDGLSEVLRGVLTPSRRRRRRVVAVGVVSASALTMGGVAAAHRLTAYTGEHLTAKGDTASGEVLRTDAPDFVRIADAVVASVPFAPGYSAHQYWGVLTEANPVPSPGPGSAPLPTDLSLRSQVTTTEALTVWASEWAMCSWARTWLTAEDVASGDRAVAMVEHFATDPAFEASGEADNAAVFAQLARAGDRAGARAYFDDPVGLADCPDTPPAS
jgi:hypothetical protein